MHENEFKGDITAKAGEVYPYTKITGYLYASIYKTAEEFSSAFPNLEEAGGDLYLSALTSLPANAKLTAGGDLDLSPLTSLPANAKLTAGGYLDLSALTSLPANAKLTAGGDLDLSALTSLPANAKLTAGGYLYLRALTSLPANANVNKNDAKARDEVLVLRSELAKMCRAAVAAYFYSKGFSFADGILAKIVSERGPVARVVIIGKTEVSYVVKDEEGNFAHGDTLAEARADLMVKRTKGDLTQFKAWTLDKEVSKSDAILAYRSITGACSKGTRHWLEQRQTPEKITVAGIIEITKGAYGAEAFAQFFSNKSDFAGVAK